MAPGKITLINYYNENSECIQSDWHCTSNKAI